MRRVVLNILKVAAAVGVSLVAGYLAFRNVHLAEVTAAIHQASLISVGVVLILLTAGQVGRSFRWGVMLEPLEPLKIAPPHHRGRVPFCLDSAGAVG